MTVSLLTLNSGGVSLEFSPEDAPEVRRVITAKFGNPDLVWHSYVATVSFGGEPFTYAEEWDEYCLISVTARGADILRVLAAEFG